MVLQQEHLPDGQLVLAAVVVERSQAARRNDHDPPVLVIQRTPDEAEERAVGVQLVVVNLVDRRELLE